MKDVVKFIFRDRIHDEVALQMDAALGSHEWLAKYPAALSKVYKELMMMGWLSASKHWRSGRSMDQGRCNNNSK